MQQVLSDAEFAESTIWLMGDFNSLDNVKGEGYELICNSGWKDTYVLAEEKDDGITVEEEIDGWREASGCIRSLWSHDRSLTAGFKRKED